MKTMRTLAAAMLAATTGTAALATDYPVTFVAGTYTPAPTPNTATGVGLVDTFSFTTTGVTRFSGALTTRQLFDLAGNVVSDLDFVSIFLDGFGWTPDGSNNDVLESFARASTTLGAGDHVVTVTYNVDTASANNGATYGGVFNLTTSDVPEPASWLMMLGGFGLLGATMRRQRRVTATVSY